MDVAFGGFPRNCCVLDKKQKNIGVPGVSRTATIFKGQPQLWREKSLCTGQMLYGYSYIGVSLP